MGAHKERLRVAFGSCNKAERDQSYWRTIAGRQPDVWIWTGDSVYGDEMLLWKPARPGSSVPWEDGRDFRCALKNMVCFRGALPGELQQLYRRQLASPEYQELLRNVTEVLGTWDDHDLGLNDGDRRYRWVKESQSHFLDFLGEPTESPRRKQAGLWDRRLLKLPGGKFVVAVHLLDIRSLKSPYGSRLSGSEGDFLGEEQWQWLEQSLAEAAQQNATMNLVVSSIPVLREWPPLVEIWTRFPSARRRFLEILASSKARGIFLLSGDAHLAELNAVECGGSLIHEVTSSGLTHSIAEMVPEAFTRLLFWLYPERHRLEPTYWRRNYGELDVEVDTDGEVSAVTRVISLHPGGEYGRVIFERRLEQLSGPEASGNCRPALGSPSVASVYAGLLLPLSVALLPLYLWRRMKRHKD